MMVAVASLGFTGGMCLSQFNIRAHPVPAEWLLAEWPIDVTAPTDYWLSTLPEDTPLKKLVRLAKIRWRIEHDYRELKTGLGLAHFEGRTFAGWHHHMTLVTAAHLFITTLRLTRPKAVGAA